MSAKSDVFIDFTQFSHFFAAIDVINTFNFLTVQQIDQCPCHFIHCPHSQWLPIVGTRLVFAKPLFDAVLAIGVTTATRVEWIVENAQTYTAREFVQLFLSAVHKPRYVKAGHILITLMDNSSPEVGPHITQCNATQVLRNGIALHCVM